MSVGDVSSDARGSGARYNDGKPPLHLIPVGVFVGWAGRHGASGELLDLLVTLHKWQARELPGSALLGCLRAPRLIEAAQVFDYGSRKYAAWNWAKGMAWSVPVGCLLRHAYAILSGEANDPESGLPHWGHIACNLIMLAHFAEHYPEGDDRPCESCFRS